MGSNHHVYINEFSCYTITVSTVHEKLNAENIPILT